MRTIIIMTVKGNSLMPLPNDHYMYMQPPHKIHVRLHNFFSCVIAEREDTLAPPPFFVFPPVPPPVEDPDLDSRHFVALDSMKSL